MGFSQIARETTSPSSQLRGGTVADAARDKSAARTEAWRRMVGSVVGGSTGARAGAQASWVDGSTGRVGVTKPPDASKREKKKAFGGRACGRRLRDGRRGEGDVFWPLLPVPHGDRFHSSTDPRRSCFCSFNCACYGPGARARGERQGSASWPRWGPGKCLCVAWLWAGGSVLEFRALGVLFIVLVCMVGR